jgi:hypothetical protein
MTALTRCQPDISPSGLSPDISEGMRGSVKAAGKADRVSP